MKRLFILMFAVLACKMAGAQATATALNVRNNKSCATYCIIIMSTSSTNPCDPTTCVSSNVLSIAAGATLHYTTSAPPPGIGSTVYDFIGAKIMDGPISCSPTTTFIGEPCATIVHNINIHIADPNNSCQICDNSNAVWGPTVGTTGYLEWY